MSTSGLGPDSFPRAHAPTAAAIASYKARRLQLLGTSKAAEDSRRIGRPLGARDSRPRKNKTTSSSPASNLAQASPEVPGPVTTFLDADSKKPAILSPRPMVSAERNRKHACCEESLLALKSLITATRSGKPPPGHGPRRPLSAEKWSTEESAAQLTVFPDAADDPSSGPMERSVAMGGAVPGGAWAWEAGGGPDVCQWLAGEATAAGDADEDHAGLHQCGENVAEAAATEESIFAQQLSATTVGGRGWAGGGAGGRCDAWSAGAAAPLDERMACQWGRDEEGAGMLLEVGPGGAEAEPGHEDFEC